VASGEDRGLCAERADAGSDVAPMATSARTRTATGQVVLDGTKTWISNGGIADFYCVFAKTDPAAGTRGITAFIVDADTPGPGCSEHIAVMAPASAGHAAFQHCRMCRPGAQLGACTAASSWRCRRWTSSAPRWPVPRWAWRAVHWHEAVAHAKQRPMFGQRWPTSSSPRPSWAKWPRWWTLPPC
jgi:acyl-CoA dehydrogenase